MLALKRGVRPPWLVSALVPQSSIFSELGRASQTSMRQSLSSDTGVPTERDASTDAKSRRRSTAWHTSCGPAALRVRSWFFKDHNSSLLHGEVSWLFALGVHVFTHCIVPEGHSRVVRSTVHEDDRSGFAVRVPCCKFQIVIDGQPARVHHNETSSKLLGLCVDPRFQNGFNIIDANCKKVACLRTVDVRSRLLEQVYSEFQSPCRSKRKRALSQSIA